MKRFLIIFLCVILLGGIGVFVWKGMNHDVIFDDPNSGDVSTVDEGLADKAVIKTVQIKENATSANRIIDVKYPSIQSFTNKDFQNYVNNSITDVIMAYKDEIMVVIAAKTPETALYTYKTSYEKYANGDYLSLVISNDYQTGGIRSNTWKDIYNIDIRSERIFYLADIFPANVNYKAEVLREINSQANALNYTLMNGAGLNSLDDKQKFFIRDGKLIIYFDPAEIAPATYGALQFEMPFSLDENGKFNP